MRPPPVRLALLAVAAAAVVAGCNRDGRPGKLVLSGDGGIQEPGTDPAIRIVVALSTLRREPSEQARVKVEGTKGAVPNALSVLVRGERVTVLAEREGWARVRDPGGAEGWVRGDSVVPAAGTQEGTILVEAWAFDRPDLLSANARRKLEPGTLLFIRRGKDLFTEVDAGPGASAWILTDRISTRPADVEAAQIVERARHLRRTDRTVEARAELALLRFSLPDSPLIPVLAAELGELPAGEAPAAPSGPVSQP
jgi:SH3-like domain-containing protein